VQRDGDRARAFAEERHVLGIAAERGDVVAHPLQGHHLIEKPSVTGHVGRAEVQEAETSHAILHRHHDYVLLRYQGLVVIYVEGGWAGIEATWKKGRRDPWVSRPHSGVGIYTQYLFFAIVLLVIFWTQNLKYGIALL